jgi:Pyruvate/2-oxoacid:ferredoxin oxidoreductase gamma subunit
VWAIPLSRIADELGSARSANMVALGAVNALCDLFPRALLERQVDALGKESLRESNLRAIEAGAQAVRRAR